MSKVKKRFLSMLSVLIVGVILISTPVNAQDFAENIFVCDSNSSTAIEPRLKYLTTVFTDIDYSNSRISVQGNYTSFASNDVILSVYLQRSFDQMNWSTLKTLEKTYSPGKGQHVLANSYYMTTSGYYRVRTVCSVMSGANIVESFVVHSRVIHI